MYKEEKHFFRSTFSDKYATYGNPVPKVAHESHSTLTFGADQSTLDRDAKMIVLQS